MTIPCALPRSLQAHRYHHVSSASSRPVRGRLAPSPTGYMHLGNAWAFLLAWLAVRSAGGTLVLRMEDIDPQRSRPEYARALVEDLRWLGLDWDEGPAVDGAIPADGRDMVEQGPCGPYFQSARTTLYAETLDAMGHAGLVYPCYCTRKELRQLAVALDDALMGITQVVRGRDILTSTPRQLALLGLWGFEPPTYAHIPLLLDGQGERLAKRHQSLGVRELRRQGVAAADIVGVLALLAGLRPDMRPLAAAELLADFRLERLPRHDVCLRDLPCVPDWLRPLCLPC